MPISALNSYSPDWIIKARVLKKPPFRAYKNARGEGKVLTVDLIDRAGTMIQGTFFNKEVDLWADKLEENNVYSFSGGQVKMANKRFTAIKNDFCITFDSQTSIVNLGNDSKIKNEGF